VNFHVSLSGRGDLAARIYRQILDAILDGRLRTGERLPPTRELARQLDVSRNTVAVAYERLIAEGFLSGRVGAGTFVCAEPPRRARRRTAPGGAGVQPRRVWRTMPSPAEIRSDPAIYDFRVGTPDPRLFPYETWRRLLTGQLRPAAMAAAQYSTAPGSPDLGAAIARYIGVSRSVRASGDDVVTTHGAQQALDLVGRVLIEPGSHVAVEEPGYPPVRLLFQSLGARVVGVPVDAEGLDVSAIPSGVRLVYVTPSHQLPLGTPMSPARRTALLAWADRNRAVVIEDDYDSEFRFSDRPLEPLQSLDQTGRVVYVGTFSKTLLPMLRLGFVVAPASLRPALQTARQLSDWYGESLTQAALARFIDEGLMARHVRKATREYATRWERLLTVLHGDFAEWVEVVPSVAGLHLCVWLRSGSTDHASAVVQQARESGVALQSIAGFYREGRPRAGLLLGYGLITSDRIDEGLSRLRACFVCLHGGRGNRRRAFGAR
jgi:GntR family transcriptional regulator/MocR family aminotransferase